jgi:hypothetical protein
MTKRLLVQTPTLILDGLQIIENVSSKIKISFGKKFSLLNSPAN